MNHLLSTIAPPTPWHEPSFVYSFLLSPLTTTARTLQQLSVRLRPQPAVGSPQIAVVCLSDTHDNIVSPIPNGDLLIHAGDLTNAGTVEDIQKQIDWLDGLPHRHKIVIAGNHDTYLDPKSRKTLSKKQQSEKLNWRSIQYLQHGIAILDFPSNGGRRLKVYGAPQIPACGGKEFAFQYPRGQDTFSGSVPENVDILVTHTPPKWHMDLPSGLGCEWLGREDWRVKPKLHVFAHVHAGSGMKTVWWDHGEQAYQRICDRENGLLKGMLSPSNWLDLLMILINGLLAFAWLRLWVGKPHAKATVMVNAACMNQATGKTDHPPKRVWI